MNILNEIIKNVKNGEIKSKNDFENLKRKLSEKYKIKIISNFEILQEYQNLLKKGAIEKNELLERILRKRPIRSLSGIVNITVLTKPYPCPGRCIFCPFQKGMPKSYLEKEPAAQRAKNLNFNPYLQVRKRIEMLEKEGHPTNKIELRIVGGTWSYYPKHYQIWFIKECFRACNEIKKTTKNYQEKENLKIEKLKLLLKKEQKKNEKAKNRIVGISIETRPDFINLEEIKLLRELGITLVELGVQSVYDDVLKLNQRDHKIIDTILATKLLKDAGFKILYQIMPNLYGSNIKRDIEMFSILFNNPGFKPDYLKIYPCALVKNTKLYKIYLKGKFKPYSKEELIELLKEIKKEIPYYVRIQRIGRDIPAEYIVEGGSKISNLRELVKKELEKKGLFCKCIRCREIKENYNLKEKLYLFREDYEASQGKEIFLSFENKERKRIYSFLRLRIVENSKPVFSVLKNSAIVREIKTFGQLTPIGSKKIAVQHRGLGKKLVKEAEKIAKKEFKKEKVAVIAGVGVRNYFRKLGYKLKETYMVKIINLKSKMNAKQNL
ncbi:MAG: elongator complex protein 3 [Minisyncoccia bacterium]